MPDCYCYPDDSKPEVKKVKQLASRAARLEGAMYGMSKDRRRETMPKYRRILDELYHYMSTLTWSQLYYWRNVVLIDPRWCGATGTGAYIAVASRIVNEIAAVILKQNPPPLFWIEE